MGDEGDSEEARVNVMVIENKEKQAKREGRKKGRKDERKEGKC